MTKIVYIADEEILRTRIVECGEELIDIKYQNQLQFGPPPECEFAAHCYTKLRKTVFEKLCQAQNGLPKGWCFRLYEDFRSLEVQQMLFEQEYQRVTVRHPQKNHTELFHETTHLISPVTLLDGSKNIPAHNTGGAIDIEIITEDGQVVDMGMLVKDWITVDPELCLSGYDRISKAAQHNRNLLRANARIPSPILGEGINLLLARRDYSHIHVLTPSGPIALQLFKFVPDEFIERGSSNLSGRASK